eukprot:TRINITY_DN2770_c1_g3_i1.p1 TRINITY_DN2770_c1_g3~~TRINITY_DN2770_c1_g3_i1.p1  ORF type:complete len:943 (-),score=138.17 TRINITY_DN2770_c1_g3_i1:18-2846(-)
MNDATSPTSLLRDDDTRLRQVFQKVLLHHHPKIAAKVNVIYAMSEQWQLSNSEEHLGQLQKCLQELQFDERILVASAFSHMLQLHNVTEEVANAFQEQAFRLGDMEAPVRSSNKSLHKLVQDHRIPAAKIYQALCSQHVELVFTAHPTQARRMSLLKKYSMIRSYLQQFHNRRLSPYEASELMEAIKAQIQSAWRTDELRRSKPSPQDEMRQGLSYMQNTIYSSLPKFLRRIDTALASIGQPRLPYKSTLFSFGSWMGGDRDGNPFVTSQVTRDVVILARLAAVNLHFKQVESLMQELSLWRATRELKDLADQIRSKEDEHGADKIADIRKRRNYTDFWKPLPRTEPFRIILARIRDQLFHTKEVLHTCLSIPEVNVAKKLADEPEAYLHSAELLEPLEKMYESLVATGDDGVANGALLDFMRQVSAFGLSMYRLDIRQESSRHTELMTAITEYLDLGKYSEWEESERLTWLSQEIKNKRPLISPSIPLSDQAKEVLDTFRVLSELPADSLGAYIISMAKSASDVLAVVLLQKECNIRHYLRVVPLFETLTDLENAPNSMRALFSNNDYLQLIDNKQECMIGYSDSGKDAGRLAAAWALYEVQEKLAKLASHFGIHLTLFHGRGGTVGRGGGPAHLGVLSQPQGTIKGDMRVTVQGEVLEQQFAEHEICFRTFDLYTSAVLEATMLTGAQPHQEWRAAMAVMAEASCEAYRKIVHQNDQFPAYFFSATPVKELGRLNIGSRPAARGSAPIGISNLRAIPWVFAWTQTRFHLPVWLGVGEALKAIMAEGDNADLLQEMYQHWTFFKVTMDMIDMVMAKTEVSIFQTYEKELVDPSLYQIGEQLRQSFEETKDLVLQVLGKKTVQLEGSSNSMLYQKLNLRVPYVNPLNLLQIECLKRLRDGSMLSSSKSLEAIQRLKEHQRRKRSAGPITDTQNRKPGEQKGY